MGDYVVALSTSLLDWILEHWNWNIIELHCHELHVIMETVAMELHVQDFLWHPNLECRIKAEGGCELAAPHSSSTTRLLPSPANYSPSPAHYRYAIMFRILSQRLGGSSSSDNLPAGNLPAGWESGRDPQGRVYYIDHNTERTTWDPPPGPGPSRSPSERPTGRF